MKYLVKTPWGFMIMLAERTQTGHAHRQVGAGVGVEPTHEIGSELTVSQSRMLRRHGVVILGES